MIRIVLVRPQGPRNVGSVLRAALNFGPAELVVVRPVKPSLLRHPDFEQMSHGVEDVAARIRVVDDLPEALADAHASFGFTARARDHRRLVDWREARPAILERASLTDECTALVFGSEENGLTTAETEPLGELVRMPTSDEHTSINLAVSVAIVLSTLFFAEAPSAAADGSTPVNGADRRFLTAKLVDVLGSKARSEPARRDIVAAVERLFSRAFLESRDARAWHLLANALGEGGTPEDYGLQPVEPGRRRRDARPESERGARP